MRYFLVTFKKKANGQIDEEVGISRHLRKNDLQMCNIILDYTEKKVSKCLIDGKVMPTDWETINEYYKKVYPNLIQSLEDTNKQGQ